MQNRVGGFTFDLAVFSVNSQRNGRSGGQRNSNITVEDKPEFFNRIHVLGVAHQDLDSTVRFIQRDDVVFAGHRFRHQFDDSLWNFDLAQVHIFHAVRLGQRFHDLFVFSVAQLNDHLGDGLASLLSFSLGVENLLFRNNPSLEQLFQILRNFLLCHSLLRFPIDPVVYRLGNIALR